MFSRGIHTRDKGSIEGHYHDFTQQDFTQQDFTQQDFTQQGYCDGLLHFVVIVQSICTQTNFNLLIFLAVQLLVCIQANCKLQTKCTLAMVTNHDFTTIYYDGLLHYLVQLICTQTNCNLLIFLAVQIISLYTNEL